MKLFEQKFLVQGPCCRAILEDIPSEAITLLEKDFKFEDRFVGPQRKNAFQYSISGGRDPHQGSRMIYFFDWDRA